MGLTFKLAWRSFIRHRRRSIITLTAVSVSLAMMIIFVGIADDGHARMAELGIRLGQGHVLVQGKGYQSAETLDYLVPDPARVIAAARKIPAVQNAAPRVRAMGLLSTGEKASPVLVSGVDPDTEPLVSTIPDKKRRVKGAYLRSREKMPYANMPADIYVGKELATTLNLAVGDRTVLTLSPKDASRPASAAFIVRGVFRTGITELDQAWVEIPILQAQKLLKLGKQATQVAVMVHSLADTGPVAAALQPEEASGLEVLRWEVALKELYDAIVLDDAGLYIMMLIIFVIVAIGIFNVVLMSVIERTKEFGVMMALGCKPRQLCGVIMAEALILSAVAAVLGVAMGLGLHYWVASVGIPMEELAGDYQIAGIIVEGRYYSRLTTWVVAKWTLVVMGLVLVSALYPAIKAALLKPLEAMRHV